jgi:hypothetical protein
MNTPLIDSLFVLVAVLFLWLVPSTLVALRAETKGYSFWGFLLIGLFASWILSLIIILNLNDRHKLTHVNQHDDDIDQLERLGELHEKGILTREEFETKKAIILKSN